MGPREPIFQEFENYADAVDGFVPFHLGPHLVFRRCCLGSTEGIIVGDWVEESENLADSARSGRAVSAIACLFDKTLSGWYRAAEKKDTSIAASLKNRFPRWLPTQRYERALALGATKSLAELRTLFKKCNARSILVGPSHGDLHVANVRVRAHDAIIIDFVAHRLAPILYDLASLEASLIVDGFSSVTLDDVPRWVHEIEELYPAAKALDMAPACPLPKHAHGWFFSLVRQIRLYAQRLEQSRGQYAAALSVALLVKAGKDKRAPEPEASRRAACYLLAERVLEGTFGGAAAAPPAVEAAA